MKESIVLAKELGCRQLITTVGQDNKNIFHIRFGLSLVRQAKPKQTFVCFGFFVFREVKMGFFKKRSRTIEIKEFKDTILYAGCKGQLVNLENVDDKVFNSGVMGDGIAIIPEEESVLAPMSGQIATVFPTKHTIAMHCNNGMELIIHIGIETVELGGEYFKSLVHEKDWVKAGDCISQVQFQKLKEMGYDITTMFTILNSDKYDLKKRYTGIFVDYLNPLFEIKGEVAHEDSSIIK